MPHTVKVHGEDVCDEKLVKRAIKQMPEAVTVEYFQVDFNDSKQTYSGNLKDMPDGTYRIWAPRLMSFRWSFELIKTGSKILVQ